MLAAALALVPVAALAEDPAVETLGRALVTTIGNHRVTFPLPPWIEDGTPSDTPFVFQQIQPDVTALLLVPPGQSIVSWTQMSGVLVVDRAGYRSSAHIASIVQPMTASCAQGQMGLTPVKSPKAEETEALILVCGRYRPTASAPNACAGGIVVAVVRESWNGAMKVYDEWCTGAFDVDNPNGWPVAPEELMRIATEMQVATAFEPLPRP